ncbi:hypothetical protein ABTE84_20490, partial [Acinetobacter baumannii]
MALPPSAPSSFNAGIRHPAIRSSDGGVPRGAPPVNPKRGHEMSQDLTRRMLLASAAAAAL